tara:strand:- start:1036 stop:1761 length:726 start_codon:yes stop_codon:yes gene_type:complete
MSKKIFIHGGSSLISKFLIKKFKHETSEFYIFCRDIKKTKLIIGNENLTESKFYFFENNLENLEETFEDLNKIPNELDGIFWVTGFTGDVQKELNSIEKASLNLKINFTNVVLCLSFLIKKMRISKQSFICVITSVAGLRGRKRKLFYCSAKSGLINFLSGLRQELNGKINVLTVIPGYISTNSFNEKSYQFLITSPEKMSKKIYEAIKKNKEIIYVGGIWRILMFLISIIPEKIFKKLKF